MLLGFECIMFLDMQRFAKMQHARVETTMAFLLVAGKRKLVSAASGLGT